ncbi:MAG: hypothetical protein JSS79_01640 [Bacteroidetes bacterium]|nr:hypothetical protein [Bacteroidota bacterium]
MRRLVAGWEIINILSIDVAVGAMIGAGFFAKIFAITVLPAGFASLGLTVWAIYTADHLLDAKKVQHSASTRRHRFHQKYFTPLILLLVAAVLIDVVMILFIRKIVFVYGAYLAIIVGVYILAQKQLWFFKELMATILYTAGVLLIPWSLHEAPLQWWQLIFMLQFALTVWSNILLFSLLDRRRDTKDNHRSFAVYFGDNTTRRVLLILFAGFLAMAVADLVLFPQTIVAETLLIAMNAALLTLFIYRTKFSGNELYRLIGDCIFLFPALYFLF